MVENKEERPLRVAFYTLGCKVNQCDTAEMAALFARRGYQIVDFGEPADVYVINTCVVTHTAAQKSRQAIRRAWRRNPRSLVVVTGCYAQLDPEFISSLPGVRVVAGIGAKRELPNLVEEARRSGKQLVAVGDAPYSFEDLPAYFFGRTRAFLKVQEGCRDFCTYCIVPYIRGPCRSRPLEAVLEMARHFLREGFVELVLTGTHLGLYGQDLTPPLNLAHLVERLLELPELKRLRLSSIEPLEVTPDLIELLRRDSRFCPHLHIPLQSGDDEILRRMGRRYTTAQYRELVARLREAVPDIAITTDVMVGFPGETEEAFARTEQLLRELELAGMHVFPYSPRPGTPAARFPDRVPWPEVERRLERLLLLRDELRQRYAGRFLGREVEVLLEKVEGKQGLGLSPHYLSVIVFGPHLSPGKLVRVRVERVAEGTLYGHLYP
ncbi:tRNA (N(6)-L-threonylcarbamoyladenosine(37)-C(2))-methylthiotransferase MtaB [Ammonifex thiophilus]|uniref:Threonylcarbamoyladenosine tRNA methylthiotransferase MtaB n=1 Tax=Ammonifex thiophilus TaxID=444093 RepID=A0A3D8P1H6_9THEO|nr:tRNA (N(6)-L-threonylcarbamoyladenosine(37)-C(2))-methylthiotransferase MtaB [Ammonifex thiophilus]RDV81286.1 tRNA (N(6)-L-threonylcarbamoyladenosine(37)-C(2))-methylthiotransferase MtaB [Ammonifex thiophilus]